MHKFDGRSYREIRGRLQRQGLPEEMIEKTVASVLEYRKARTDTKRKQRVHGKAWQELMAALQHERRIVRSMVRYKTKTPAPERDDFINAYYAALDRVYATLSLKRRRGGMPEHSHWTDYVPERIKDAFAEAAAGIPPRHKAKVKEPFQRTSPIDLRNLRYGRLLRRTMKERETVLLRLQVNPDDTQAKRKAGVLDTAIARIKELDDNAHVPDHWRDLVPEMLGSPEVLDDEPETPSGQRQRSGNLPAEMILYMNRKKKPV